MFFSLCRVVTIEKSVHRNLNTHKLLNQKLPSRFLFCASEYFFIKTFIIDCHQCERLHLSSQYQCFLWLGVQHHFKSLYKPRKSATTVFIQIEIEAFHFFIFFSVKENWRYDIKWQFEVHLTIFASSLSSINVNVTVLLLDWLYFYSTMYTYVALEW